MAASPKRPTTAYKPPRRAIKDSKNPRWFVPVMASFYILGLAWILTYYITKGEYPLHYTYANLIIGFGLFFVGFIFTTRWK